ncbi:MAG: glycoside hydrolase family 2 TIM barrel-domain containing protein, partial [Verrucomicrobiota bacterium]
MPTTIQISKTLRAKAIRALLCLLVAAPMPVYAAAASSSSTFVTSWASGVLPEAVRPEYPRPGLVRTEWLSLNGWWDYATRGLGGPGIQSHDGAILVPFPLESALSRVHRAFSPREQVNYFREFSVPPQWRGQRILLHFDAVNWEARVELNGKLLGTHRGGYDRFSYDITDALTTNADQRLTVSVINPADRGMQPRGKQSSSPHGIWYTSSSGIWQTVWLEPVSAVSVDGLELLPDLDQDSLRISVHSRGDTNNVSVEAVAYDGAKEIGRVGGPVGQALNLAVPDARRWSPADPFLYNLKVKLTVKGMIVDEVKSYFGMRKISVDTAPDGQRRIMLNGRPYFQLGVLDQGYWPDGIYTAPTDEALRSDIELMRKLGLNMCRKHVKIEPDRWYYWCDKLGLLVWQDMPSAGGFAVRATQDLRRPPEAMRQFKEEMGRMVRQHISHPSIVMWIAFNEGWGQSDTAGVVAEIKAIDPSRLVIGASGWNDIPVGDVKSLHQYPGPATPSFQDQRAVVCGECGGLGLSVAGHVWPGIPAWSYTRLN